MQIHFYISEHASNGNRLKSILQEFVHICPFTEHKSTDTFGKVMLEPYNDTAIAVVMVSGKDELQLLAQSKMTWERFKTILVLPEESSNLIGLCRQLRPIYITDPGSDLQVVAEILAHISRKQDLVLN